MRFIYHLRLNKEKRVLGFLAREANYRKVREGNVW